MSVRTWSFVHFILTVDLFTNKKQFDAGFSERLKIKDKPVSAIWNPTEMSHQCSICFYYVVTIALSVITDSLIFNEYLCFFN